MYDSKTNQNAKVKSTELCADLGQIEYLFTDKTGTLTLNEMTFKHFSLDNCLYTEYGNKIFETNQINSNKKSNPEDLTSGKFKRFFKTLSLCHTVQLDMVNNDGAKYNASSPDELSFILFCQK